MPLTRTAVAGTKMALMLLKGRAKELLQSANLTRISENAEKKKDAKLNANQQVFELIMDDLGCNYFPVEHAYRRQVSSYTQHYLVLLGKETVHEFGAHLQELNNYLLYFPREKSTNAAPPKKLKDEELVEILNQAKPHEWYVAMLGANIELYDMDWQTAVEYFEQLEVRQNIKKHNNNKSDFDAKTTPKKRNEPSDRMKNGVNRTKI